MIKRTHLSLILFILYFSFYSQNEPTDCVNSVIVCGSTNLELNSNGIGIDDFALPGNNNPDCIGIGESQSLWLRVNIVQSGTLAFTITPESSNADEDYDFAVFGPNRSCNSLGNSIRCSSTHPPSAGVSTLTGLSTTETDTTEGPGEAGNGFVSAINAQAGEEYYILIDNFSQNGGFDLEFTGTAVLPDSPQNEAGVATSINLTECDIVANPNDGSTNFDLESNTPIILGGQINRVITYHISEEDANLANRPLSSPYLSVQNNQTIYVRIENTITQCFVIDDFILITNPPPNIANPEPLVICDDNNDGNDSNGFSSFLLNIKDQEILNGLSEADYTLSYHLSRAGAESNTGTIDENQLYTNISNPQIVFARVQENSSPFCVNIVDLELEVAPLPIVTPASLVQCDEFNNPSDGITLFNLNEAKSQLTTGVEGCSLVFFENMNSAELGVPAIVNTEAYQNTGANQQLFVRVIDEQTNCFRITSLDLVVSSTTVNDAVLSLCDDDGIEDGFVEFDLREAESQILSEITIPNLVVSYYETVNDALSELNSIQTFINVTPGTQGQDVVYARVEDNVNGCFGINQVSLFVNPLPDIEEFDEMFLCEGESITIDSGLQLGNPNDFEFLWAPNGETTESINVTIGGSYEVVVTNRITQCFKTRTVNVILSTPATIINPIEINDASENNIVTVNVSGLGDYEYAIALNNSNTLTYQDSPTFTNVPAGFHQVFVWDKNGCGPDAIQDISVIGFPKFFTPNGDGIHEIWNVSGVSAEMLENSIVYIFDRFGRLLAQVAPVGNGWDGTFAGLIMPSDEYWFSVELPDGRIRTGSFSLIR